MTLDTILEAVREKSHQREQKHPLDFLKRKVKNMGATRGFARALRQSGFSVIAEIKRKSPSMGVINEGAIQVAHKVYHEHPVVAAISVLTQSAHFGGSPEDLQAVRHLTQKRPKPILRKDFIFSDYEVYFSRWIGADAILLMANVVEDPVEFKRLHDLANSIGLDVLCEVHEKDEIARLPETAQICGINSRKFVGVSQRKDLRVKVQDKIDALFGQAKGRADTKTDLSVFDLYRELPKSALKVAESGMSASNVKEVLGKYPFDAALIGTSLLKSDREGMVRQLDEIEAVANSMHRPASSRTARVPLAV